MDTDKALRERIKELNCLYGVSRLIERNGRSREGILEGLAALLPPSWQHPEITAACVTFEGATYETGGFRRTPWMQEASIRVSGKPRGRIQVCYLEEKPVLDEGPFLREERLLINAVAERVGRAIERIRAQEQLEEERKALERKSVALQEILERLGEEKDAQAETILSNLEHVVLPALHILASRLPDDHRPLVDLVETSVLDVLSPFTRGLERTDPRLSPVEIQICSLIRHGLRSKEIARVRGLSVSTVHRHRERIREKLGLKNEKVNLAVFLGGAGSGRRPLRPRPCPEARSRGPRPVRERPSPG